MEKFEDKPLSFRMQWHIDYLQGPDTTIIRDTMRKALEVIKRYEDAPVGFVMGQGLLTEGAAAIVQTEKPGEVKGQRVRLVVEGGEG